MIKSLLYEMRFISHTTQKRSGSALIVLVAVTAVLTSMIAFSTAKISQASLGSLDSTKIILQAQQYAAAEANVLQATNYDDLQAHGKKEIQNTDYYSEVEFSEESNYNDDVKQRTATISIYRGNEVLPRYTLQSVLTSKNEVSGVPIGAVIAWPANSLPQGSGTWLECNGQSCVTYPQLVAVLGRSTVPDYRGAFLRAYGSRTSSHYGTVTHQSGELGVLQGDAIRNITGNVTSIYGRSNIANGAFNLDRAYEAIDYDKGANMAHYSFNASRVVPTANENRPINIAVKYLIKAA